MLEFTLAERIYKFVNAFGVVHVNQVYRFFRDMSKPVINRNLAVLEYKKKIYRHSENYLSVHRKLDQPISNYSDRLKAIYVMCMLRSDDILWFSLDEFPQEILFVNNDGVCYSVVVFNSTSWAAKYTLVKKLRSRITIKDVPDPVNYIAVVPNEDLIPKVRGLGFAYYAMLDNNGKVTLEHDEPEEQS